MNLIQLEYFVAAARFENISKAAVFLHISQPTLSQSIIRLEHAYGVNLFDRNGRNIRLNEQGRYLLNRAEFILSYIRTTEETLLSHAGGQMNEIKLVLHTGHVLMQRLVTAFIREYPYIRIKLESGKSYDPDHINIISGTPTTQTAKIRYLCDDEILLAVSSKSALSGMESADVGLLKDYSFIDNETGFLKEISEPFCKQAGFTPRYTYTAHSQEEVRSLIRLNYGICFWPESVAEEISGEGIRLLSLCRPRCSRNMLMTLPEIREMTEAEQKLVSFILSQLGSNDLPFLYQQVSSS